MWRMWRPREFLTLLFLLPVLAASRAAAADEKPRVLPHETIAVAPSQPRPAAHYRHIEALVARLAELDEWQEEGLTTTSGGGMGFAPGDADADPSTCTPTEAFAALAALGPDAIPALLAHLDDRTGTRLSLSFSGGFGGTWYGTEIDANPADDAELAAIRAAFPGGWRDDPARDDEDDFGHFPDTLPVVHRVTVGDGCYALLGQITNRVYEAVRYQPTACHVVNSPTRDPRIARAVRAQWAGKDPRVELARRLTADLHTTRSEAGWSWYGGRQAAAGARLALYYPKASEALLVRLVDQIEADDAEADRDETFEPRRFLRGLCGSDRPVIRAALLHLALRTRSRGTLEALLPGTDTSGGDALFEKITALLESPPPEGIGHWPTLSFLRAIRERWPDRLTPVLLRLLGRTPAEARVVAELAYTGDLLLPVTAWRGWLDDEGKAVPWQSAIFHRKPIERLRLCDVAALQIARQRDDLAFDERGGFGDRDRQIARMRRVLDEEEEK